MNGTTSANTGLRPRVIALAWALAGAGVSTALGGGVLAVVVGPQIGSGPDSYNLGQVLLGAVLVSLPLLLALTVAALLRFGRAAVSPRREKVAQALSITLLALAGLSVPGAAFAIVVGLAIFVLVVPTGVALLIASRPRR